MSLRSSPYLYSGGTNPTVSNAPLPTPGRCDCQVGNVRYASDPEGSDLRCYQEYLQVSRKKSDNFEEMKARKEICDRDPVLTGSTWSKWRSRSIRARR